MRTIIIGFIATACITGCSGSKKGQGPDDWTEAQIDSIEAVDSLQQLEEAAPAELPKNADGLFDDFIYNYAANTRLQKKRTHFPLPVREGESTSYIQESEWTHDSLFTHEAFYTMLYDREEDMDLDTNTDLNAVNVEWIYLDTHKVRKYLFRRQEGLWMLTGIEVKPTAEELDDDFLTFFHQFANDSIFQREHLAEPLKFVTSDPDDDFQILETTLETDQWFAFRPLLPTRRMTNVDYGQQFSKSAHRKIVDLRGIGNGNNSSLQFQRIRGEWKLVQFEDLSN